MALNIPNTDLPGTSFLKGIDTGSTLFSRIMQPILEREKQKQLEQHFQEKLKLDKATASRAAQAAIDAHKLAMNKLDPTFEARQYEALENYWRNKGQSSNQNNLSQETNTNVQVPTQPVGEGQGVYSNEGLEARKTMPENTNVPSENRNLAGPDLELMKSNPMLRGWFKKHFGYDPLAVGKENVLHGPARDAADLDKLKKQVGENSEVYQNAKAAYDAQLDAKKDLRDLRARTKAGLKPGEKEFFDKDTGAPLGKEIPLTAAERQSEEGNILFNELYPYVYKGASPFSGEGSITRLEQAASHYKTDPKARKMFDDFLLAEKMLAATTVNESATLKAGKTNRTYNMLKESLESQDIPNIIKKLVKQFEIPASAQLKASMRYQKALSEARKKARKGTPATQKLFYNPELQAENEQNIAEGNIESNKKEIKKIGGKTYEKINGEWYEAE